MFRLSEKSEQKTSSPRVSSMSIFTGSRESKCFLINKLNIELIKINNHVNNMDEGPRRETMKYLLGASSYEDPYQLELMKKILDEELTALEKQRGMFTFRGCLAWSLCSLGVSISSLFSSLTEYQDAYGRTQVELTNNVSLYALLSTVVSGAAAIRNYNIESKLSNINNIKNIISGFVNDNRKLASLLDIGNPDELRFRQDFYERHILPGDRADQAKKMRAESVHYTEWNLNKSFIIPSRIGVAFKS